MRGQSTLVVHKKKKVTFIIKFFESFEMRYHIPYLDLGMMEQVWHEIPHFEALKKFL